MFRNCSANSSIPLKKIYYEIEDGRIVPFYPSPDMVNLLSIVMSSTSIALMRKQGGKSMYGWTSNLEIFLRMIQKLVSLWRIQ